MDQRNDSFGGAQDQQNFIDEYRQDPQAVSQQEAMARYEQVDLHLPAAVYQQSAQDIVARLTPEQRMQWSRP